MGTKVQCNSYFPRCYSMRDLNDDANGCFWPLSYDDKTLKREQCYNTLPIENCINGYFGYDKEEMKQTIIKHETIFRNQVYELHRLYKIQRGLMDELKSKELHRHRISVETSQSSPFSSPKPSEGTRNMWHISQFPFVNSTDSRPSISGVDKTLSPLSSIIGNNNQATQSGEDIMHYGLLESKPEKFRRKLFDLELPADEYLDNEEGEGEHFEEEKTSEVSLGNGSFLGSVSKSNSCLQRTRNLADLNETIQVEEIQECDLLKKPKSSFLGFPMEFFKNTQRERDSVTCPNAVHLENNGEKQGWLPSNHKAGQSRTTLNSSTQGFYPEKFPMYSSGPKKGEFERDHGCPLFLLSDPSKRELWRERGLGGFDISERSKKFSNYSSLESVGTSYLHSPYLGVPSSDRTNSGSSSASSWKKPLNQSPITVQALPEFKAPALNKSSTFLNECPGLIEDKWHFNYNLRPVPSFGIEQEVLIIDGEGKSEDPPGGLPWFREKPPCNIRLPNGRGGSTKTGSSSLQDYPHQFVNKVGKTEKFEVGDSSSDIKILGFPIFDKPHVSKDPSSSFSFSNLSHNSTLPDLKKFGEDNLVVEKGIGNNIHGFKNHINLNSRENEDEASFVIPSVSRATVKITLEIDLETPAVPETEEGIPFEGESLTAVQSLEDKDEHEEHMRTAAEAIVTISLSSIRGHLENSTNNLSEKSLSNSLHWFAGVVLGGKDSDSDSDDYFERMTLKLPEMKVEEYRYKALVQQDNQEEETRVTTPPSRPRKGHAGRGRQRRDFQKDILPGLASLSRQEVTEDLQTIGGLMKENGRPWTTGVARRNAARNGWARGRRCSRSPATSVAVSTVCSSPKLELNNIEMEFDERSLIGWGKTLRRPRRRRCLAGNPSLLTLTQV